METPPQLPVPRSVIAFALGFFVVFLGASIGVQAQPAHSAVPMTSAPLVSPPAAVDLWWWPDADNASADG